MLGDKYIEILAKCPTCGFAKYFKLDADKYRRWQNGEHIQNVFPELSTEDRERLISGICPNCWDKIFYGE